MYPEENYIAISALQHYLYCPRQCALIHLDQVWVENLHTAEGRILHENVDQKKSESRVNIKYATSLAISSARLGISGKADMVEFHKKGDVWIPYPIEYKKGAKASLANKVQLCAQGICLEEMLKIDVLEGALFLGKNRRRYPVKFDNDLRLKVEEIAKKIHEFFITKQVPKAEYSKICTECSLLDICLPTTGKQKASSYLKQLFEDL